MVTCVLTIRSKCLISTANSRCNYSLAKFPPEIRKAHQNYRCKKIRCLKLVLNQYLILLKGTSNWENVNNENRLYDLKKSKENSERQLCWGGGGVVVRKEGTEWEEETQNWQSLGKIILTIVFESCMVMYNIYILYICLCMFIYVKWMTAMIQGQEGEIRIILI